MKPTHTLVQLTDLHLREEHDPAPDGDTLPILERALAAVASAAPVTALLLTGDLAEHGAHAEYQRLRSALRGMGVPVVYVVGNHDDRAVLRAELADEPANPDPYDHVVYIDGLRIVVLDSTVPGSAHGELRSAQLDWLRAELAAPAPAGTVLALHHPPLPSPVPMFQRIELRDRSALATAISGSDVRFVVAGHVHTAGAGLLGAVPVWTGGSIHTAVDPLLHPEDDVKLVVAPSVSRIDVFPGTVTACVVPLAEAGRSLG